MTTIKAREYYWAAAPLAELPEIVRERSMAFRERLDGDGRMDLWRRLERTYYGLDAEGQWRSSAAVTFGGDSGENVMVRVNEFRSIVRAIAAIVTAERPAFIAQAMSGNAASLDAAPLCEGLVSSYYETKGLEDIAQETARYACILGEGFTHLRWDPFAGRAYTTTERPVYEGGEPVVDVEERESVDPMTGEVVRERVEVPRMEPWIEREGDIVPESLSPLQVVRDLDATTDPVWALVAHRADVWTLAARYPELRERILAQRGAPLWPRRIWVSGPEEVVADALSGDVVTVWCLYHLPTDAVPKGRYALVCGDVVLYDGPFTMRALPVIPLIPERQHDTASGDTPVADLLCLQEVYDMCWSALLTPIDALGVQNVSVPEGQDIDVEMISRGLQLLKYQPMPGMPNGGKPEPLLLLRTPEELWKLVELIPQVMQRISGINSVTRGAPDSNIKAGNYAALISAQAQQYHGPLARGVLRHHEQIGTMILETLRTYATTKRVAEIGGLDRQTAVREFVGSDLTIERVSLDMANPLTRQMAGRLEVAQLLLAQPGMIQSPEQFLQLLATGRIEPMYRAQQSQLSLIKRENERLADGKEPPVALVDRHDLHIAEHAAVINDPDLRARRPDVMQAVLNHLMEHVAQAATIHQTPALALATGQRIPPQMAGPMPPPGPAPVPEGGPSPGSLPRTGDAPPQREPGRAQVPGSAPSDALPMMPTNPATGQRVQPGAGGGMPQ